MNIFEKMLAVQTEMQTVAKNLSVSTGGKNSYRAVGERDVLDAVKPLEAKYGIYSYPAAREVLESHILETESVYNGQALKKTSFMSRIRTVYRFVNTEKPDEYIETTVFSEGIDPQDKGSGKAMTYGDKYALLKAYKISTGEDPDQEALPAEEYRKVSYVPEKQMQTGSTPAPEQNVPSSARDMLAAVLKQRGMNAEQFAAMRRLHKGSSEQEFITALHELGVQWNG